MESLFGSHGSLRLRGGHASNGLFRSHTTLGHTTSSSGQNCCDGDCSDSECGSPAPVSRRIATAKKVLAEATRTYTPSPSFGAAKSDMCKNTGAIGPLMVMIQSECDDHALQRSLDTLSFLLLDKANRKVVQDLGGLSLLMSLYTRITDWSLLRMTLSCMCSLVRFDDRDKERVWQHVGSAGIKALLNPHAGGQHLLEVLCHIRKIAFTGKPHGMLTLLEPDLITVAAGLLSKQHQPQTVVAKVCKFLRWCAEAAEDEHTPLWRDTLPTLVPLLRDPLNCERALGVLLSLSEHSALKDLFVPSNAIAPVVALLAHPTKGISVTSSCIISALVEQQGPCIDVLCGETMVKHILRALTPVEPDSDVCVAVLYILHRLVTYKPTVVLPALAHREAPRLLVKCVRRWQDTAMIMGAMQLLESMGYSPELLLAASHSEQRVHHAHSGEVSSLSLPTDTQPLQRAATHHELRHESTSSALSQLPTFDRSASSCQLPDDLHQLPHSHMDALRPCPPTRQTTGWSDDCLSSVTSMPLYTPGRTEADLTTCSEDTSPLACCHGGASLSGLDVLAAGQFVALQRAAVCVSTAATPAAVGVGSKGSVALLRGVGAPAAGSSAALQSHLRHPSGGYSSCGDGSSYPSRTPSPLCIARLAALAPDPATPAAAAADAPSAVAASGADYPKSAGSAERPQRPSLEMRCTVMGAAATPAAAGLAARFAALRSWSSHPCLTVLDGRLIS